MRKIDLETKERLSPVLQHVCGNGSLVNLEVVHNGDFTSIVAYYGIVRRVVFMYNCRVSFERCFSKVNTIRQYLDQQG